MTVKPTLIILLLVRRNRLRGLLWRHILEEEVSQGQEERDNRHPTLHLCPKRRTSGSPSHGCDRPPRWSRWGRWRRSNRCPSRRKSSEQAGIQQDRWNRRCRTHTGSSSRNQGTKCCWNCAPWTTNQPEGTNNYVLAVVREIIHIVQRTHAVRNVVHSHTVVLQIHNHTNRLGEGIVFYAHDLGPTTLTSQHLVGPTTLTSQHLVGHFNIRGRLRNVGQGMREQSQRLNRKRFLLIGFVVNVVVSLLGLLNRSIKNIVNIVTFCGGVNSVDILLSIGGCA